MAAAKVDVSPRQVTGVQLTTGERLAADVVVANADAEHLYRDLLPDAAPSARLRRAEPSTSGVRGAGRRGRARRRAGPPQRVVLGRRARGSSPTVRTAAGCPGTPRSTPACASVTDPAQAPPGVRELVPAGERAGRLGRRRRRRPRRTCSRAGPPGRGPAAAAPVHRGDHARRPRPRYRSPGGAIYGTSSNGRRAAFLRPAQPGAAAGPLPRRWVQPSRRWACRWWPPAPGSSPAWSGTTAGEAGVALRWRHARAGPGSAPRSWPATAAAARLAVRRAGAGRRSSRSGALHRARTVTRGGAGARRGPADRPAARRPGGRADAARAGRGRRREHRRHRRGGPPAGAEVVAGAAPAARAGSASRGRCSRAWRRRRRVGRHARRRHRPRSGAAGARWCGGPRPTAGTSSASAAASVHGRPGGAPPRDAHHPRVPLRAAGRRRRPAPPARWPTASARVPA